MKPTKEAVEQLWDAIAFKAMDYFEQYVDTIPNSLGLFTSYYDFGYDDAERLLTEAQQNPKVLECVPIEFIINCSGGGDVGTTTFNMHITPNLLGTGFTILVHHEGGLV